MCLVKTSFEAWVNLDSAGESHGATGSGGADQVGNMPRVSVHLLDKLGIDVVAAM